MTNQDIRNAYQIVEEMRNSNETYPLRVSDALFRVKKALQDQWDFQQEEIQKLYDRLKPEAEGDKLHFADTKDAQEFADKINELSTMEVELEFTKPKIRISLAETAGFTLTQREVLDVFIDFVDD